jgi:hypothetical protein
MWDDFQFDFYQTLHVPQSLRYDSCNMQLSHYNFTSVTCEKIFSLTSTKHCMCLSDWDMIPAIYSGLIIISRQSHVRRVTGLLTLLRVWIAYLFFQRVCSQNISSYLLPDVKFFQQRKVERKNKNLMSHFVPDWSKLPKNFYKTKRMNIDG